MASAKIDLGTMGVIVKDVQRTKFDDRETVRVTGYTYFTSKYPQWFFVVLANCYEDPPSSTDLTLLRNRCEQRGYCQGPLLAKVNMVMTNGNEVGRKHFSYDEMGARELYITYVALE